MNSNLQFFDGIKTADIQEILIRSANDLISLEAPNYQFVAARLLLFSLRKQVYNGHPDGHPPLLEHVQKCIEKVYMMRVFSKCILMKKWEKLNSYIDHDRDYLFTYAGIRQVADKYLVQDRSTGEIFETPQFMYMMVAATLFQDDDKFYRLGIRKKNTMTQSPNTDSTSRRQSWEESEHPFVNLHLVFLLMLMTPSIVSLAAIWLLVTTSHNALESVSTQAESVASTLKSEAERYNTQALSPSSKSLKALSRCCTQNGIRGGSATVHFPIWHQEIEDIIVLKNNKGTEDNRVRKLDYSIQISKLFYERFIANGVIYLFSPHDVPGLYDAFGTDDI